MLSIRFRLLCALTAILMATMACAMPFAIPAVAPTKAPAPTSAITALAPTETEPTTESPTATMTATPEVTATITLTLEPSVTATLEAAESPTGKVTKETNCRKGPGSIYGLVVTFQSGTTVQILARDLGGGYVYVQNPDKPEEGCWILEANVTVSGDVTPLPAFTPPPTPSPAPDFTVSFKKFDACSGSPFAVFEVVNTGGFQFRSAYVRVTDLKTGAVTENSLNAFDIVVGCIVAQNIAPLKPGGTGYLQSDKFKKNPGGDKLRATFHLCTEQNLKGACVDQALDFIKK
jgi:hypothetical protein